MRPVRLIMAGTICIDNPDISQVTLLVSLVKINNECTHQLRIKEKRTAVFGTPFCLSDDGFLNK